MATKPLTEPAVHAERVSFSYGRLKVLDELSLEIPQGISFGLLGPNGAGKTTLIRLAVGLLRPSTGAVRILGQRPSRALVLRVGYMPHLHSLYNELTVIEHVDFFARIYHLTDKKERSERVEEVIRLVDMWDRHKEVVSRLSGGMKQRVSLACAIVHNPPLLFLDEPTVGLDPELRVVFWEYFGSLTRQGHTLVISSHPMDDAAHCDRLGFIRARTGIPEGAPDELKCATGRPDATLEDTFLYYARR